MKKAQSSITWWPFVFIAVAATAVVTWVVLAALHWFHTRSRRTEDAMRCDEIEKSIRLMTARLYRTRQLWQEHQLLAVQQQHNSCIRVLHHESMDESTQGPCHSLRQQLTKCGSSSKALGEDAEALLTSSTAAPSSSHFQFPPPRPLEYQQSLQTGSETSSYLRSKAGGNKLGRKYKSKSCISLPCSERGMRATAPPSPSIRKIGIAPPTQAMPSTRMFAGISKAGVLRRALCATQRRTEQLVSSLFRTPRLRTSFSSPTLTSLGELEEPPLHQAITNFQLPEDRSELDVSADECALGESSVETLLVYYRGDHYSQWPNSTDDGCVEEGIRAMVCHTDVAATQRCSNVRMHLKEVEEKEEEVPILRLGRFKCTEEKH
ncbi:hypothetical protein LtaPh_2003900 [Leishmania tarentolae]|uniref:Uncharacterized protein n=1 Tax=Leishmania tarentolae TaxID=5689 RepID=A0A640KKY6_LEITA|nr:hypothetical protein LtaPh_2003900 [Leishmania tarentolae]